MEALQLLQGFKPETTAVIDDLLLQASQQFEQSFVVFGMYGLDLKYQASSYYMLLKGNRYQK